MLVKFLKPCLAWSEVIRGKSSHWFIVQGRWAESASPSLHLGPHLLWIFSSLINQKHSQAQTLTNSLARGAWAQLMGMPELYWFPRNLCSGVGTCCCRVLDQVPEGTSLSALTSFQKESTQLYSGGHGNSGQQDINSLNSHEMLFNSH